MARDSPSWPHARRPPNSRRARDSRRSVVVNQAQQLEKDGASHSLGKEVGQHGLARHVHKSHNLTGDQVTKELGRTQNVLRLLEGDRIESHAEAEKDAPAPPPLAHVVAAVGSAAEAPAAALLTDVRSAAAVAATLLAIGIGLAATLGARRWGWTFTLPFRWWRL